MWPILLPRHVKPSDVSSKRGQEQEYDSVEGLTVDRPPTINESLSDTESLFSKYRGDSRDSQNLQNTRNRRYVVGAFCLVQVLLFVTALVATIASITAKNRPTNYHIQSTPNASLVPSNEPAHNTGTETMRPLEHSTEPGSHNQNLNSSNVFHRPVSASPATATEEIMPLPTIHPFITQSPSSETTMVPTVPTRVVTFQESNPTPIPRVTREPTVNPTPNSRGKPTHRAIQEPPAFDTIPNPILTPESTPPPFPLSLSAVVTREPTVNPTPVPTSSVPTPPPTTLKPTPAPSPSPTTETPSSFPSPSPTTETPSSFPSPSPSTEEPTHLPTPLPTTREPSSPPTGKPTPTPTPVPTTKLPTPLPTHSPTTRLPTLPPTPHTPQPTGYDELHSVATDLLGLRSWEEKSMQGIIGDQEEEEESCSPPSGVSDSCCLGSFSTGGDVSSNSRFQCSSSMLNLEALRNDVQTYFGDNSVVSNGDSGDETLKCDVCQIVELARSKNLRLSFVGDSTQNQVAEGFACELERRNYIVKRETKLVNQDHDGTWENRRHLTSRIMKIRSPMWEADTMVTMYYHQIYLLPTYVASHMRDITGDSHIVVLGFGLHWWYDNDIPWTFRRAESYTTAMASLLRETSQQGHVQLLVHRETTAEHYDSPGGDWFQWQSNQEERGSSKYCEQLDLNDPVFGWRERSISEAAQDAGYDLIMAGSDMPSFPTSTGNPELVVLPYLEFTAQQYTQHPFRGDHQDCTHYCSSPFLYMTLWRSLRLAMDRQFGMD